MTRFVASHLVDGVVDGVQPFLFGALGEVELALGGAARSNLPWVAPFSASTLFMRFSLVEGETTSPMSSANLAACSASS